MKKQFDPPQELFDAMLAWLDPDRDEAGRQYERIRLRLIKIFSCRGCGDAEDLADETMNRVTVKVSEIVPGYEGDPALYFYGVARKVHHEYLRIQNRPAPSPPWVDNVTSDDERLYECLDRCMDSLPEENRQFVLRYYQEDKRAKIDNRNHLAAEMGIAINALRIRAHRIRSLLKECVKACITEPSVNETDSVSYS